MQKSKIKYEKIILITEMGENQFMVVGITESGTYINIKSDKNKQKIIDKVLTILLKMQWNIQVKVVILK